MKEFRYETGFTVKMIILIKITKNHDFDQFSSVHRHELLLFLGCGDIDFILRIIDQIRHEIRINIFRRENLI